MLVLQGILLLYLSVTHLYIFPFLVSSPTHPVLSNTVWTCISLFVNFYNVNYEMNILQLSSIDEKNHDDDKSQRDLFEELKTWRKEYARLGVE